MYYVLQLLIRKKVGKWHSGPSLPGEPDVVPPRPRKFAALLRTALKTDLCLL